MSKKKKLYLSEKNKMIAGVCGGLAEYFDIDATLIRIGFVIVSFISGIGLLTYIILWIVLPPGESLANSADNEEVMEASVIEEKDISSK